MNDLVLTDWKSYGTLDVKGVDLPLHVVSASR
jgi:hypothetical protein